LLYQLPTGKVVEMSIEQYLALTDEDIQYLISINYGEHISSPWYDSSVKKVPNNHKYREIPDKEVHDTSIDYVFEDDEPATRDIASLDEGETSNNIESGDSELSE